MKKFIVNIKSALYNLNKNRAYALFCIVGTALIFVFVTIILQLTNSLISNDRPFVNADRTIYLESFTDKSGRQIGGIAPEEIATLMNNISLHKSYAMHDAQYGNAFVNDKALSLFVSFVNGDYWTINQFDFIEGRPFTSEEAESQLNIAIIKEDIARSMFKGISAIGKKVSFQGSEYKIIGVVKDYSSIFNENNRIWVPYKYNRFTPDQSRYYNLYILPKDDVTVEQIKEQVSNALSDLYKNKNIYIDINPNKLRTVQQLRMENFGGNKLSYGIPMVILLLLLIPALNIIVLSIANANNRATEIAIRRSMGASMVSSFMQIILESFILVIVGTVLGLIITIPISKLIGDVLSQSSLQGGIALVTTINYKVLFMGVLPISLFFTLLCGGLPAYLIAKGNIAETLKGGSKC